MDDEYDAGSIQVLEGLEAVRKRPGMYLEILTTGLLSTTASGKLSTTLLTNTLQVIQKQIDIVLNADHSLSVRDYGRGIPVGVHEEFGISVKGSHYDKTPCWG